MHFRRSVLIALALAGTASGLVVGPPASAAPKTMEGTIAVSGNNAGSLVGAGFVEIGGEFPVQQACPSGGQLDGVIYKFFDLKGDWKDIKVSGGIRPVVSEDTPVGLTNEYDVDVFGFDAKCQRIEGPTGASGTGSTPFETFRPKKPVRYLVVNYYRGPYPNLPIKVELIK